MPLKIKSLCKDLKCVLKKLKNVVFLLEVPCPYLNPGKTANNVLVEHQIEKKIIFNKIFVYSF